MRRTMLLLASMALTLLVVSGLALAVNKVGTLGPRLPEGNRQGRQPHWQRRNRSDLRPGRQRQPPWWFRQGFRNRAAPIRSRADRARLGGNKNDRWVETVTMWFGAAKA